MNPHIEVLHLENDPADAELVQATLAEAGLACRITRARTRNEFETTLRDGRTEIILANYQLQTYDGMSALRLTRKQCSDIPFIFISDSKEAEAAIEALTQGATDYVLKHNLSRLVPAVRQALQESRNRHERRKAGEALQRSNDMLRAIIEAAPVAIFGLDLDGNVQSVWNPTAEKMLGWSAKEVMGKPLPVVPSDDQEEFGRFRKLIRCGTTLDGEEVCRRRSDGTLIDYSIYTSPLHDAFGHINGNIAVLVDITERKQAETALKASEAKYFDLYDKAPDMYLSVNAQTASIEKCNQTLADTLGYSKAEIIDWSVFEIFHPDCQGQARETFQEFLKSGAIHDKELQLRKKDGSKLDVSLNVSAVRTSDGGIVSGRSTLRDITEHRRNRMINAARIHLMQFAVSHTIDELLEETLNEAENMTESVIGFYHFVDDDQQSLSLQNWSTRTKAQFCRARGKGLHYRIADAGVWVDCVRDRKPVVHNDYLSLPHRKGMPEGHAEIVRELVVPVMRGKKIKAILGVGNKPADYSEKDVEAMSLLADLAWEIAERKQADQQIALMSFALNSIHEAAFMIDEKARFQYINDEACRILEYSRDELLTMTVPDVYPELPMERWSDHWCDLREHGTLTFEGELKTRNDRILPVEINANYVEFKARSFALMLARDITERKQVERERLANLRFFESMDKVNRAMQGMDDLEQMMRNVLDTIIEVFDCDKVQLIYPCNPKASTWAVQMECAKPGYRGMAPLNRELPMTPEVAKMHRIFLEKDGPVVIGAGTDLPVTVEDIMFSDQSGMGIAIYPKNSDTWGFSMIQCSHPRIWTKEEIRIFEAIGRRLTDSLTSLLAYRTLRESEAAYRQIVDTANEGICVLGPDTLTTFVNARMAELLGCTSEEMIGRPLTDFMFEEDVPDHKRKMANRRQGMPEYYQRRFRHRNGQVVWTHVSATPIFDAELHFNGSFGMVTDITEQKLAENQLKEQIHFLQQLIDSIPIPVYYKSTEGLYLGCNSAFETFMGFPRKEIVGKTVHEVVPKKRADKHREADLALLRHPGVRTYEVSGIYKDGKRRDVIFNKATFVDANDRVAGTVGALMDITERKEAERERLANLQFFEDMDRVNRAIQSTDDLENMMKNVLDVVLSIFDCDRAYLAYPCDPGSESWTVPMERNKPEYPGVLKLMSEMPMDPQVAETFRILLAADGPVTFGPGTPHALPEDVSKQFGIKCFMAEAIYPKTGSPWQFGIHQCAYARVWTTEEVRVFETIGRRLADSLTSLLSYRDLRRNEKFLDNIVEHIPDMIFVKDAQNLRFVKFNKAGERLVGYPREELLGKTDHDFFPKEMADFFTSKDRQVLHGRDLVDIPEETIRNRKNEKRILRTKKIPILDETGAPQYLLGISEDITERKQSEEFIRKLSQAIEQSPVSIVITDLKGKIEFVNAKFTQITGYTSAEAMGKNPRILKSGETSAEEYSRLWETISSGGIWQGEFHNRKKNGELFWEQATIAPVRTTDNVITHYVAVKEDITERKILEAQLRQSQKMEAVGRLAGGVAHDFNNMLGVIIGYAELALGKISPDDSLHNHLEGILEAGFRSTDITRQLLAFARKQTVAPKILDLNETVEGMLKLLRRLIGEDIELAWLPGQKLWSVKMDPSQIDQILANLCVNARDAIDGVGKVTIETHSVEFDDVYCADHKGFHPGEYVMLAVSDNGSGMDKSTMDMIFEPFFTTKGVGKGTGLGLATVYGIVKQNEGFVNVYSEPEHGSTFKVYLPRRIDRVDHDQKAIPETQELSGNETILVVEDEILNLQLLELMLEEYGYQILAASSPSQALLMAKEYSGRIHLLLTDLIMPEMNGRDLAKEITSLYPDIICVFMSGYTGNVIVHHGVLDEGLHFLQKPFSKQNLAAKLREVLHDQRRLPK